MRQLGNARADAISFLGSTDVSGSVVDSLSVADSLTAAAPGFDAPSLSPLSETQPTNGGTDGVSSSDLSSNESSIAAWLSNFRPFASSLVTIDGDSSGQNTSNTNLLIDANSANDNASVQNQVSPFFNSSSGVVSSVTHSFETDANVNFDSLQNIHDESSPGAPNNDHMLTDVASHGPGPFVNSVPDSFAVAGAKSIGTGDDVKPTPIPVSGGGGGALAGGSSTTSSTTSSTSGGSQTSGLVINVTYDASVANAPAGFKTDVVAAVQY